MQELCACTETDASSLHQCLQQAVTRGSARFLQLAILLTAAACSAGSVALQEVPGTEVSGSLNTMSRVSTTKSAVSRAWMAVLPVRQHSTCLPAGQGRGGTLDPSKDLCSHRNPAAERSNQAQGEES